MKSSMKPKKKNGGKKGYTIVKNCPTEIKKEILKNKAKANRFLNKNEIILIIEDSPSSKKEGKKEN